MSGRRRLNAEKHEIRLLLIQSSGRTAALECDFATVSLDSPNLRYVVLSYNKGNLSQSFNAPGSPVTRAYLSQPGVLLSWRHAVADAVRDLSEAAWPYHLWVNELCINHRDAEEVSQHGRLMGRIHARASMVAAWQGPATEFTRRYVQAIWELSERPGVHWKAPEVPFSHGELYAFLNTHWWRQPSAQEALRSHKLVFFHGPNGFSMRELLSLRTRLEAHRHCCRAPEPATRRLKNLLQDAEWLVTAGTREQPWFRMAMRLLHCEHDKPLHHIFSYAGLAGGLRTLDYRLPLVWAYEYAINETMQSQGHLEALHYILPGHLDEVWHDGGKVVPLPSWVPTCRTSRSDLKTQGSLLASRAAAWARFIACGNRKLKLGASPVLGILKADGTSVDTIEAVGEAKGAYQLVNQEVFVRWRLLSGVDKDPGKAYVAGGTVAGGTVADAYVATLCFGGRLEDNLPNPDYRPIHDIWWRMLRSKLAGEKVWRITQEEHEAYDRFDDSVSRNTSWRRFAMTREGYFGMVPEAAQPGDAICVLSGGQMPYVVRALSGEGFDGLATRSTIRCRFVGDAYVHGLMHGEAVEAADREGRALQTFHIH